MQDIDAILHELKTLNDLLILVIVTNLAILLVIASRL